MARRQFRAGAAAIAQRRLTSWFQFIPTDTNFTGATGGTVLFTLNAAALALRPFTIVRTRFALLFRSDTEAASEAAAGAFGMAVVSDQATAIGVTAVPTPITDMASDFWFVHQIMYNQSSLQATGITETASQIEIDSKAMRKVDIGQDLVIVAEAGVGGGFNLMAGGRMLVKVN